MQILQDDFIFAINQHTLIQRSKSHSIKLHGTLDFKKYFMIAKKNKNDYNQINKNNI